jgi:hypothetical protein
MTDHRVKEFMLPSVRSKPELPRGKNPEQQDIKVTRAEMKHSRFAPRPQESKSDDYSASV